MKVVILGAGFGGLETAACLFETLGRETEVTLIDIRSAAGGSGTRRAQGRTGVGPG